MKASKEFVKGSHNIAWLSDDFKEFIKDVVVEKKVAPTFQKLPRSMNDAEIESELKPGICELDDILAFLDAAPEECKDGYYNLFYFPAFVVRVRWDGGGWSVGVGRRGGDTWGSDYRLFSPATERSAPEPGNPINWAVGTLEPFGILTLVSEIEERLEKIKKLLK